MRGSKLRVRFFGQIQKRTMNVRIHTLGGFLESNPNQQFWDSQFETSIFDQRFSEQKRYTTDAVHVLHPNWTYVAGALTFSH